VLASVLSLITAAFGYVTAHPGLIYGGIGAATACGGLLLWDVAARKAQPRDDYVPTFFRPTLENVARFGLINELLSKTQQEMTEVLIAYRDYVKTWNQFWRDYVAICRRYRTQEEQRAMLRARNERLNRERQANAETLERRLEQALRGMRTRYDESGRPIDDSGNGSPN